MKPPQTPDAAALDHATLRALVAAMHNVADMLDPAGAGRRREQEQAEQPPQRRKQRRSR